MSKKIVWLVPESHGGIFTYSRDLWPYVEAELRKTGYEGLPPVRDPAELCRDAGISLIHVQHEYGLFGKKIPLFNKFKKVMQALRAEFPETRIVATAHSVLGRDFRYHEGTGLPRAFTAGIANLFLVPFFRSSWIEGTWSLLDGVIVHSGYQMPIVSECGVKTTVIPHFVPVRGDDLNSFGAASSVATDASAISAVHTAAHSRPVVVVFGFVSLEKGQDIAIEAFARVSVDAELWIAGGVRRKEDAAYHARCVRLVRSLGLRDKVRLMGYIPDERVDEVYKAATLVLAPFRSTSGSGSLVQAMARGAPVLASDLLLNRELAEREQNALACFKASDTKDCAKQIERLLGDRALRRRLREGAESYAKRHAPGIIAAKHVDFYRSLIEL